MPDASLIIAVVAIVIGVISLVFNWRHSESLFRRREYPAVAWYMPKISKEGNDTAVTTTICNYGPKGVSSIFLGAFICRGFKSAAWCRSEPIDDLPLREELVFPLTSELEKDISERFGGVFYDNGWRFMGKPKTYKITLRLEYLPLIADTSYFVRKSYYLIKPAIENSTIKSWELKSLSAWRSWLPCF